MPEDSIFPDLPIDDERESAPVQPAGVEPGDPANEERELPCEETPA